MTNLKNIATYNPKADDCFFLDTNVWIYIFCPIANHRKKEQEIYSRFYSLLVRNKHAIFVNALLLSEFANAYLRIDFNLWKKENQNFRADYKRDFVGTERFGNTVIDVKRAIGNILKMSNRMTDNFNVINIEGVFAEFGSSDFNDAYYIELARANNLKIVTHDSDFFNVSSDSLEVISANVNMKHVR